MPTSPGSAEDASDDGTRSRPLRERVRFRTWAIVIGAALLAAATAAVLLYRAAHHHDPHTPVSALPLVSGAKIIDTFEEPPVAHPFSYIRWIVIVGAGSRSSRDLADRLRYRLIYDDWRELTPPLVPGTYAALSPDREFRLALLTTREDALARSQQRFLPRSKRLFLPRRVLRVLRRLRLARQKTLVVQIDRNTTKHFGVA